MSNKGITEAHSNFKLSECTATNFTVIGQTQMLLENLSRVVEDTANFPVPWRLPKSIFGWGSAFSFVCLFEVSCSLRSSLLHISYLSHSLFHLAIFFGYNLCSHGGGWIHYASRSFPAEPERQAFPDLLVAKASISARS